MRLTKPARLLPALALLLPGIAVTAASVPAQAADPAYPFPFKDESVQVVDKPGYSSDLVTGPDGASAWTSSTLNSTVAQDYGLATDKPADVSDRLRSSWVEQQPYPAAPRSALAGADSAALGYLDADSSLDAVYLVKGGAGTADSLVVTDSQETGFASRLTYPLTGDGALSVTTTEAGAGQPAYVWIRYADGLRALRVTHEANLRISLDPVTVVGGEAGTGTFVDVHHHGTWLDEGRSTTESLGVRQTSLALLVDTGDDPLAKDRLRAVMKRVTGHTDAVGATRGSVTLDAVRAWSASSVDTATAGRSWLADSARIRYSWVDTNGRVEQRSLLSYVLGVSARSVDGNGANAHNTLFGYTEFTDGVDRPTEAQRVVRDDNGAKCGDDTALEIDVAHSRSESVIACSSVATRDGADHLVQNAARFGEDYGFAWGWLGQHSGPVDGQDSLGQLHPKVVFPCLTLLLQKSTPCSAGRQPGNVAVETTLAAGGTNALTRSYRSSEAWFDRVPRTPATPDGTIGRSLWTRLATSGTMTSSAPLLVTPLPLQRTTIELHVNRNQTPTPTRSKPIPVAYLAAPPQVAGLGQKGDAPEFAATSSSGTGSITSTATRIGVKVGAEFEDPLGTSGASVELSLQSETTDEKTLQRTIETAQAYRGLVDDDVVVYRTIPSVQWRGTVIGSSTGVGAGTPMSIDLPTDGTITSAASVTSLAKRFPLLYGDGGQLEPVLDQVFNHDVGDPGSYMSFAAQGQRPAGAEIDDYCDGSYTRDGDRQLKTLDARVPLNPFLGQPYLPPRPDVLVSDRHDVQVGTGNAEGATFAIDSSQTVTRVQATSLDLEVTGKAAYFTAGVSGGVTWGNGWTSTLSDGSEFSSFVGNIPSDDPALASETYNWRSFLCQKTVSDELGAPMTAWVLDYTVDDYRGTGALTAVKSLRADGPVDSATTDPADTALRWTRDGGTVKAYDWRLEALGSNDVRTARIAFASPTESKTTDTTSRSVAVGGAPLLAGQLYRWKATATDFTGARADTDWQYFTTRKTAILSGQPTDGATGGSTGGPAAVADRYSATEDKAITFDVLANDTSASGSRLAVVGKPVIGTATVVGRTVRYVPRRDRCGVDTFDYRVTDPAGRSATGTVVVRVACVDDRPVARDDRYRLAPGQRRLEVPATGVLANDRDADRDDLTARLVRKPSGVGVVLRRDGGMSLVLREGAPRRTLVVRYRACDRSACSAVAAVRIRR